ncbi:hypothetical protein AB8U03_07220 [Clostridium sp. Mt-5]|uniref:Protein containing Zn-finger domain n=1 Tax=Clostridium moutaii TaxID=3240932 RepID=A0ABV4BMI7_9CLOT
MKDNYCIFDKNKVCDDCGECKLCDLNSSKKCNNCGKCLEMEGYDMRAIKIDDIIDDENESRRYEKEESNYDSFDSHYQLNEEDLNENSEKEEDNLVGFINDIDGLKEVLENEDTFKEVAYEEYPGLIRIQKKTKNK